MKKKLLVLLLALAVGFAFTACGDSGSSDTSSDSSDSTATEETAEAETETTAKGTYGLGETWTVDGVFNITFTAVTPTDERNQFYEGEEPAEVVIIDYNYENIGFEDEIMGGLFVDVDKLMDSEGNMCQLYPVDYDKYAQTTPIGGKCEAQTSYGLKVAGSPIKVYVALYDDDLNEYKATFELEY